MSHTAVTLTSKTNERLCVCISTYDLIPSHPTSSLLTRHGKASQCAGLSLGLTHPLLAALPRHLDPAWHGAVRPGQHHVHVAARHTGDLPIAAHALVLTAGEEGLAVLIDRTVQNTHVSAISWRKETQQGNRVLICFLHTKKSICTNRAFPIYWTSCIQCLRMSSPTHQCTPRSSCVCRSSIHTAALYVCHRGSFQSTSGLSGGRTPGSRHSHPGSGAPRGDTWGAP